MKNLDKIPTPRTEAEIFPKTWNPGEDYVYATFARQLERENAELREALNNLAATARTFRNVPKDEQEWTPIDDEALNAAYALLSETASN